MDYRIAVEPLAALPRLGGVSIAFDVERILDMELVDGGLGGFSLTERAVAVPYRKDYDAIAGEAPTRWAERFDIARWGLISALAGEEWIGGATVAVDTPGVRMLEGRDDLAVLWDLRVAPAFRGLGVGSALFGEAERWAAARGCRQLKIETQNVNLPACRFYAHRGCTLGAINRFAYREFPDEVQLLWYRDLAPPAVPRAAGLRGHRGSR